MSSGLTALMNNLPGMAYRYRVDGQYSLEFASEGCLRLTGYRPEQLTDGQGPSYADLIHLDERETILAALARALRGKKSFQATYRIRTASGEEKWVWEQGGGTYSKEGALLSVEGFVTDFTRHKEMEQELRRREARLRNENELLRSPDAGVCAFGDLVGKSEPMRDVYRLIRQAAELDVGGGHLRRIGHRKGAGRPPYPQFERPGRRAVCARQLRRRSRGDLRERIFRL